MDIITAGMFEPQAEAAVPPAPTRSRHVFVLNDLMKVDKTRELTMRRMGDEAPRDMAARFWGLAFPSGGKYEFWNKPDGTEISLVEVMDDLSTVRGQLGR